jgi:hypothetical protein
VRLTIPLKPTIFHRHLSNHESANPRQEFRKEINSFRFVILSEVVVREANDNAVEGPAVSWRHHKPRKAFTCGQLSSPQERRGLVAKNRKDLAEAR